MTLRGGARVPVGARPVVGAQGLGQTGPTARDARPDGSRRYAQDGPDLGVVASGHVPQHHGDSELLGQPGQGGVDIDASGGVGRIHACACSGDAPVGGQYGNRPPTAPPQLVEGGVGGDPVGPCGESGPAPESGESPHYGDERLLGCVHAVGVVAGEATADGVDPVMVSTKQLVESPPVASLSGVDQVDVLVAAADGGDPRTPTVVAAHTRDRSLVLRRLLCRPDHGRLAGCEHRLMQGDGRAVISATDR